MINVNFRKNVFLRYFLRLFFNIFRHENNNNKIILNSIPKSGTFFLQDLLIKRYKFLDYYNFISSTPSLSLNYVNQNNIIKKIKKVFNFELVPSHIFYSKKIAKFLIKKKIPMIFLYRNPYEVFYSEINYISNMNKFHKMHKYYYKCKNFNEKFFLCLNGLKSKNFRYESFDIRILKYLKWLKEKNVFSINYDNLLNKKKREAEFVKLDQYLYKFNLNVNNIKNYYIKSNKKFISHTYTGFKKNRWKKELSLFQKQKIKKKIKNVLIKYPELI